MKILFFIFCFVSSATTYAASRSIIFPGTGQAVLLIEEFDRNTGEGDDDPYVLSEAMQVPWKFPGNGDRGKILEDDSLKLVCVERAATWRRQCQFILKASPSTQIDPLGKSASYRLEGDAPLLAWVKGLGVNDAVKFEFNSSDRRLKWIVTQDSMLLIYAESR